MSIVEIKDLYKSYGKKRGVNGINFSIEEGEIFGFVGPNGSGKSTTIRSMLGLIKKNSGEITIFNKNIDTSIVDILSDVGYLPSEVFYYDNLKAIDLLRYSASFYEGNYEGKILELAAYLDLDLHSKIDDMSLGNKKKVGIIQGLIHEPNLIVLDEPTSGLDPLMQQKFFELLKKEQKRGATILFSSHILSEVQRLCDRVAIIKDGVIVKIEEIKTLSQLSLRNVTLTTKEKLDLNVLSELNITEMNQTENIVTFKYAGEIKSLLKMISELDVVDLLIDEPDLEDIFMHYYE